MVFIKPENEKQEQPASKKSTGYKVFSVVRSVFVYLLAAAIIVAALLFASDKSPQKSVFGIRYYNVLTPSMEPTYSVGDMVFVKLCGADAVNVGDVITFNPSSGGEAYLTHRVTEKLENYQGTGLTCFHTKGDANDSADSFTIDESRLIGVVKFHIPKLGYIVRFVQLKWYFVVPLIALVILFFYLMQLYFRGDEARQAADGKADKQDGTTPEKKDAKSADKQVETKHNKEESAENAVSDSNQEDHSDSDSKE